MIDARGGEPDPICFNANIVDDDTEAVGENTPNVDNLDDATLPAPNTAMGQTANRAINGSSDESTFLVDFGDVKGPLIDNEGQDDVENAMTPTAELL